MVSFVRDYVELRIDYSIVRALTNPAGIVDGISWSFPEDGSADLLLKYINRALVAAEVVPEDHILLTFEGRASITISLRSEDRVGPEAAHFVPAKANGEPDSSSMWIW